MLELQDNGTSSCHWEYNPDQLPYPFHFLDIWDYFRIAVPAFNDYFECEYVSIRCKAGDGHTRLPQFSPVFVEVNPGASGIHREFSTYHLFDSTKRVS